MATKTDRHSELTEKVREWNSTDRPYPKDRCIPQLFEDQVFRTPDAVAVEFEGRELTYSQLNARANQLAHYLREKGVGPDVPVGICMDRSLEMMVSILAILKAGGCYVPLDPLYPAERLGLMAEEAGVKMILADAGLAAIFPESIRQVNPADTAAFEAYSTDNPSWVGTSEDLAYMVFTSGSTGTPKGVAVPHRGVVRLVFGQEYMTFGPDLCMLQLAPVSFDASTLEIWGPLLHGGKCVLYPGRVPELEQLENVLQSNKINALWLTASLFNLVIDTRPQMLNSVETVLTGGEALSVPHVRKALEVLPNVQLVNGYGPTESTTFTCCYRIPKLLPERVTSIPIGRPIANTQAYILDSRMQPVPIGVTGELYIGGDGLARGYVNRPELTAERFVANPFSEVRKSRLYKTGDLCRWLGDGNIEFLGRTDDQVKIRGFRIELGEIESVLRSHPLVGQAVVTVREDEPGQKVLVGYVVLKEKGTCDEKVLREYLATKLPEYMVPSAIVELDTIPLTASGKADRNSLPLPGKQGVSLRKGNLPRSETEKKLALIWQEVLNIDTIFREDEFFRLGGNSIKAIQVAYRIHHHLGIQIPVSILFEKPVLSDIAHAIDIHSSSLRKENELTISTVPSTGYIPQSSAQKRLWLTQHITGPISYYNVAFLIVIQGDLHSEILEKCLQILIQRHNSLRTTFDCVGDKLIQKVSEFQPWNLPVVRLGCIENEDIISKYIIHSEEQIQKVFDLQKGPLFDFQLMQAKKEHYALLINMHHLITDGWSMGLLIREIGTVYSELYRRRSTDLVPLTIQYADYAQWQTQNLDRICRKDLDYWLKKLKDMPDGITLPTDYPRPSIQTFRCSWEFRKVDSWLYSQFLDFCSRHNVTLYMLFLAVFKALLYRYTQQEDIIIGSPISGRTTKEVEHVVGFFVNTLVVRTTLSGNLSFRDLLNLIKADCLEAHQHQDLPYCVLIEKINPPRLRDRNTLFQVMFAYQDARYWKTEWAQLSTRTIEICSGTSIFDFTLFVEENEDGLLLRGEYNTDLYQQSTIQRFLREFEQLALAAILDPNKSISRIIITEENCTQPLGGFHHDDSPSYPQDRCVPQLFEYQVFRTPDAVAVEFEGRSLTYSQLNVRANQLAHYLREKGVGPDVPVGICMDRSLEMMVSILAILKAGGCYVPLDPLYPAERLGLMAEEAGVKMILADAGLAAIFPESIRQVNPADTAAFEAYSTDNPSWVGTSEDLAYMVFTSGSTGTPKGVAVPHRGVVRLVFGQEYMTFGPDLCMLQLAPVSFDASTLEIWGPLLHGGKCVLYPGRVPELEQLENVLQSNKINALWLTASLFNLVIDTRPQMLNSVETVLTGGEALSVPHVRKALEVLPNVQLVNGYGPTESTTFTCCYRIPKLLPERVTSIPIGRPIANTQAYILDSRMQPVPIGVTGELYIGGDGLARGYVNRPELTAERFVANPFSEVRKSRLYKTGDLCRWLGDGNIEFLGRTDDQVKIRGFRIELGEIESVLRSHPLVGQAVVTVREDEPGQKVLVGYVVLKEKGTCDEKVLREYLATKLPEYMVPSAIVELDTIPLTASGKADRKQLPRPRTSEIPRTDFLPQTATEIQLAEIWKRLLKREIVYRDDHFFRLGGHSLLAAELFFRIQDQFSLHLPIPTIFEAPTLGQLAEAINRAMNEMTTRDLVQIKSGSGGHPIFYLPGIGGHTLSFYHLAEAMKIDCSQYGLNLRGLDGKAQPQETIEEMAAYFVELVRTIQPHGPYNLCGFSFGGRVAFEMALQLQRAGEPIGFLGMLGATAPGYPPMPENPFLRIGYRLVDFSRIGFVRQWRYLRFKIRKTLSRLRREIRNGGGNEAAAVCMEMPHQQSVVKAAMKAWYRYKPARKFEGDVTVIREGRSLSDLYARYTDPEYGWGRYVEGNIRVHQMDCGHMDLFRPPFVEELGRVMEQCLRESIERE